VSPYSSKPDITLDSDDICLLFRLSSYLEAVATGKSNALRETLDADQMKAMQTLVEKYSHFAEVTSTERKAPEKLTVVCIGSGNEPVSMLTNFDADTLFIRY
jgi:hypothetical protein